MQHAPAARVRTKLKSVTVMTNLEMKIYTEFDGINATVKWNSEKEYQVVKRFFLDNGARVSGISSNTPTAREFVFVESRDQIEGLDEFVHSLREK
jgi:hypothetical protein